MITAWLICIAVCEILSFCIAIAAKKTGVDKWALCLVFFAFPFFVQKIAKRFSVMTIPMKKYGKTVLILLVIALIASIAYVVGAKAIDIKNPTDLTKRAMRCYKQVLILPIAVCTFIFYLSIVKSTIATADRFGLRFKGDVLLYLLVLPCAITYLRVSPEREVDLY